MFSQFSARAAALSALPSIRARDDAAEKGVTFTKDVAPIFFKNCVECHRPGEAAPFSALSYKDAPLGEINHEQVVSREMPPGARTPRRPYNDRRLTEDEIETITAWVDGGAEEGDPKHLPPQPEFADGWRLATRSDHSYA